jgi:hypothetical protein
MAVARLPMAVVAPSAMIAATRAYSIRSWPDSSLMKLLRIPLGLWISLHFIIVVLLLTVTAIPEEMLEAARGNVNYLNVLAQRE